MGGSNLLTLLLVCITVLAGCPGVEPGPGSSVTFNGQLNVTDGTFRMDGEITEAAGTGGFHRFENVTVYLYTEDGERIVAEHVGLLDARANVSITSERIPHYVIIDSPGFWETRNVDVDYYERQSESQFTVYTVTDRDQLPVVPKRAD